MNYLVINPSQKTLQLQVGVKSVWLHSQYDVHSARPPEQEGWSNGHERLSIALTDQEASHILFEWIQFGPFDMTDDDRSSLRLPDDVRTTISKYAYSNQST